MILIGAYGLLEAVTNRIILTDHAQKVIVLKHFAAGLLALLEQLTVVDLVDDAAFRGERRLEGWNLHKF